MRYLAVLALLATSAPVPALAHPGAVDRMGCHANRRAYGFHCHYIGPIPVTTVPTAPPSSQPRAHSTRGAYRNCAAARAAGAAPVYRGQPGYGPHLDPDGNGVGCE